MRVQSLTRALVGTTLVVSLGVGFVGYKVWRDMAGRVRVLAEALPRPAAAPVSGATQVDTPLPAAKDAVVVTRVLLRRWPVLSASSLKAHSLTKAVERVRGQRALGSSADSVSGNTRCHSPRRPATTRSPRDWTAGLRVAKAQDAANNHQDGDLWRACVGFCWVQRVVRCSVSLYGGSLNNSQGCSKADTPPGAGSAPVDPRAMQECAGTDRLRRWRCTACRCFCNVWGSACLRGPMVVSPRGAQGRAGHTQRVLAS
jgi:hypothetical protein